jgi:hypothetical protein
MLARCASGLARRGSAFDQALREEINACLPSTLVHLPGGGQSLCRRLTAAVLQVGAITDLPWESAAMVAEVGARCHDAGVSPEMYAALPQLLLRAIRDAYRGEWSSALSSAWIEYLMWFRAQLTAGAHARGEELAAALPPAGPAPGGHDGELTAGGGDVEDDEADDLEDDDLEDADDLEDDDFDDDEDAGLGHLMVAMTRTRSGDPGLHAL